ncbi:MAG: hypothetical protein FWG21_05200 [Oscillospiraceae bacterium]|nr:hypothetical protein [Oscillospiraceae bacterium]
MDNVVNSPGFKEYDSFADFSREQGSAFRTSFLGFDKEDVISYIDRLVRDITDQKNSLEAAHINMTEQNRDLIERINRYEQDVYLIRQQLEDEKQYNENAREREELFRKAIGVLQEKVEYLQNNSSQGLELAFNEQMQKANSIIVRLREELLAKDVGIGKMTEEISKRNKILMDQDKLLSMKEQQLIYYVRNLEELKVKYSEQSQTVNTMSEEIGSLQQQLSVLENRLIETTRVTTGNSLYHNVTQPPSPPSYPQLNQRDYLNYSYAGTNSNPQIDDRRAGYGTQFRESASAEEILARLAADPIRPRHNYESPQQPQAPVAYAPQYDNVTYTSPAGTPNRNMGEVNDMNRYSNINPTDPMNTANPVHTINDDYYRNLTDPANYVRPR